MLPKIQLHRPRGVLPKLDVRKRTVVDYQPSWLLVAVPAVAALAARRRSSGSDSSSSSPEATDDLSPDDAPRRRRAFLVVTTFRRRRPGAGVDPYTSVDDMHRPGVPA